MAKLLRKKPKWFNLSNYPQNEFDLYLWTNNIYDRYKIHEYIVNSEGSRQDIERLIHECRKEGFSTSCFRMREYSVKPVTGNEILKLSEKLCKQIPNALSVYNKMQKNIAFKDRDLKILEVDHELRKPFELQQDILYLSVNLNTPQNTLVELFTKLIKDKQQEKLTKSGITQEQINKWIKYQVLAYIDLDLFALEEGRRLPNTSAGKWLFPDSLDKDVADFVKRNTKPLAEKLMKINYIKSLANQTEDADIFKK